MPGKPLILPSPLEGARGFGGVTAAWRRMSIALAWRPEWPVAALASIAWLMLAMLALQGHGDASHAAHASSSPSSAFPLATSPLEARAFASLASAPWANAPWWLMSWLLMSFAMMVPATLPAVRHVALNSIDARRAREMAVYLVAYVAIWGVFGVMAFTLIEGSRLLLPVVLPATLPAAATVPTSETNDGMLLAILLAIATAWQLTRTKRRAIVACKRTVPLPPDGLRADRACARFGVMQAWRCMLACWPLMLLMAALPHPHPLLPMAALTLIVLIEERARNRDRLILPIAGLFAAATVTVAIAAVVAP